MADTKSRKLHYDILRILAAFSVVMLHSAAQFWYDLDIRTKVWGIANSYDAVFRFGVPIFVMISGAIFLDKNYTLDIKRLYKHNILRLVVLYVIWSAAYGLYDARKWDWNEIGVKGILKEMLSGRYHLWFIPMLVGIYVLLPVLKSWIDHTKQKTIEYFLVLFFILQVLSETLRALTIMDEIHYILDLAKVEMICGYIGYFVLGYYLAHIGINGKLKKILYAMTLPAVFGNVVLGVLLAWKVNAPVAAIYDSFGIFTFIISVALFVFVCEKGEKANFGKAGSMILKEMSANTLGVYVMHVGLMEFTKGRGFHSMIVSNIVGIPLYAVVCFVICALVAAVLRRIPFIGRFLC
ncbi:MAG: acyltransferase family protein [Lachnospiraceae bacterium]|nr:acyltransferase family protein [Lachnospiraceae bacterium]